MPNDQFFSYIMANTCYIQRDDEVRYVLDQHIQWDFFLVLLTETTVCW